MSEVNIRKAEAKDMSSVLLLIKELAEYEKAPNEVAINEDILKRDGFGGYPLFQAFVAERNEEIVDDTPPR